MKEIMFASKFELTTVILEFLDTLIYSKMDFDLFKYCQQFTTVDHTIAHISEILAPNSTSQQHFPFLYRFYKS